MGTRAVFLVHGVGSHKKGEWLESFLEPLLWYLQEDFSTRVRVRQRPTGTPAEATVEFLDERWETKEVWWQEAFYPQPARRVLLWGVKVLIFHAGNIFAGALPLFRGTGRASRSPVDQVYSYSPPRRALLSRLYDIFAGISLAATFFLLLLPVITLAAVISLAALLPLGRLTGWLGRLSTRIVLEFVASGGDQYALMYTQVAAQAMRQQLLDALAPFTDGQRRSSVDSAVVIAHSAGATLAYSVLNDPNTWRASGGVPPFPITFVTAGSSLNISSENVPHHPMWKPLSRTIEWVDVWARYDWVPHGPPSKALVSKVRGEVGGYTPIRVVNRDSILMDHSLYWSNIEEVMSRLLYIIAGNPRRAADPAHPSTPGEKIRAKVDKSLRGIPSRRKRVGVISLLRLGVPVVLAILAVAAPLRQAYVQLGELVVLLPEDLPAPLDFLERLAVGVNKAPEWLVGYLLLLLAAFLVYGAATSLLGAVLFKEPWRKPREVKSP